MSTLLRIEDCDSVRLLVINRPDALNALNMNLYDAIRDGLNEAAVRDDIAVVVDHRRRAGILRRHGSRRTGEPAEA